MQDTVLFEEFQLDGTENVFAPPPLQPVFAVQKMVVAA
jgi:hypothetical protein